MNAPQFRRLALALPEATEGAHMGHPDFRVRGKVFATLGPEEDWAMVKLTPPEQEDCVRAAPAAFEPFPGAWGRRGCTKVHLAAARVAAVRRALTAAWRNTAPQRLVREFDGE